ncbi:MAG TPA: DUF58 domain-containing protein [Gaiellaceae bacterium]|nr:DUF58 domain-containing protein [Gaiellaceae bacterium]
MSSSPLLELEPHVRIIGSLFGSAQSRRRGTSDDVVSGRPYQVGDDIRRIDWATSARLSAIRGEDHFIVRESYGEEAPIVCFTVDRSSTMALYPREYPWLHKPDAVRQMAEVVALSASHYHCPLSFLDSESWLPPSTVTGLDEIGQQLETGSYDRPEDTIETVFERLRSIEHLLPGGTFVFCCSDFMHVPEERTLAVVLDADWELVPVVVQDPIWEQSYPEAAAEVALPVCDESGQFRLLRQSREEVRERREAHEARLRRLEELFTGYGFPPIILSELGPAALGEALTNWNLRRRPLR